MSTYTISVSHDTPEAEQFVAWLRTQGHAANINNTNCTYVDGTPTNASSEFAELANRLWDQYCAG